MSSEAVAGTVTVTVGVTETVGVAEAATEAVAEFFTKRKSHDFAIWRRR